jgi:hypothetical protein
MLTFCVSHRENLADVCYRLSEDKLQQQTLIMAIKNIRDCVLSRVVIYNYHVAYIPQSLGDEVFHIFETYLEGHIPMLFCGVI